MSTTTRTRPPRSERKVASADARQPSFDTNSAEPERPGETPDTGTAGDEAPPDTPICQCIEAELERYFDMLDGQAPHDLYRMVMHQAEQALLAYVMQETRHNQSKAAAWLGISRGTLRGKLADKSGKPGTRSATDKRRT